MSDSKRDLHSPTDIPPRSWKDIGWRVFGNMGEDRILSIAGGVVFFTLLALFPAVAALISLYGLFTDPASINQHIDLLSGFLPEGGLSIVREQVERLTASPAGQLGLTTLLSLAITLWSANGGVKAMFEALNVAYGEKEDRGFVKLNAITLALTVGALILAILALALITLLPLALDYLGLSGSGGLILRIVRWPLLLAGAALAIAVLYRVGPSRQHPQWRWVTPGSAAAAVIWLAASLLFSWYTANFGRFNATYGSLGAAIGFMTWLWISVIVVLAGAELNAELERQAHQDTKSA